MITLDGPAAGSYAVRRAPRYLRAVVSRQGKCDVLDQFDDAPTSEERIFVYERIGKAGTVHVNRGKGRSGFYALAQYRFLPHIDGESVRDNAAWRTWAEGQAENEGAR